MNTRADAITLPSDGDGNAPSPVPHTLWGASDGKQKPLDTGKPTLEEYAAAAETAYTLTTGHGKFNKDFTPPDGFTLIKRSEESQLSDGFSAAALRDRNGNVIVTFEGTVVGLRGFNGDSLGADAKIAANATPEALKHAVEFVKEVQQETGQKVFVDGHSLGGIEAEAAAKAMMADKKLNVEFGGGMTFGATGLPGNAEAGTALMHNYVKYGDTVGNNSSDYRRDALAVASSNMAEKQDHYGKVEMIGSPKDAALLNEAGESQNKMLGALVVPSLGSAYEAGYEGAKAVTQFYGAIKQFHPMTEYEKSLGLTPGAQPLYPFITDDVNGHIAKLGGALKDTGMQQAANAAPENGLASPDPARVPAQGAVRSQG